MHTFHQISSLHFSSLHFISFHFATLHYTSIPIFLRYFGSCMLRKNGGRCESVGGDLNLGPPEYEAEVLRFPSRCPVNAKTFLVWTRPLCTVDIRNCVRVICVIFMFIKFSISLEQKLTVQSAPPITHVKVQTWIFSCHSSNLHYNLTRSIC